MKIVDKSLLERAACSECRLAQHDCPRFDLIDELLYLVSEEVDTAAISDAWHATEEVLCIQEVRDDEGA